MNWFRLWPALLASAAVAQPMGRSTLILVRGADGAVEYKAGFDAQVTAWQRAAQTAAAEAITLGATGPAGETPAVLLEKTLTQLPPDGPAAVWLVLIGHGTWDGKAAWFNLEGPDVSAPDLAAWLKPLARPLVVIDTSSCSAPFLPALAGPGRTIITATRSGNEKNFARFGGDLAAALTDPAADYDEDGTVSLLELFLRASSQTTAFYLAEGRIQSEHALIDDNGDGQGTPAAWFRGLRVTTPAKNAAPPDGAMAQRQSLVPDPTTRQFTAAQLTERDRLEARLNALRERKKSLPEAEYYQTLESLFRELAEVYAAAESP